ncbi:MAG: hypothetical protein ABJX32_06080 [Tateyamaria sp.]|uniref:hypothetical protein n=1 Tax=Tateyamaria sp. TaxID=1929288 RepID=UPI00329DB1D0
MKISILVASIATVFAVGTSFAAAGVPHIPPANYDKPFGGFYQAIHAPQHKVHKLCRERWGKIPRDTAGCVLYRNQFECTVIAATNSKRAGPEMIERHERGHCNGWKHAPRRINPKTGGA